MRCHKAKQHLNERNWNDPEFLEHLRSCPSCARLASAQKAIDSITETIRTEESFETTDLSVIKAKLATYQNSKEPFKMLKHAIRSHPRLGFGLAVFVTALLFLTLVPLPYQQVTGYNVSFAGVEGAVPGDQLAKALGAIGYGKISIDMSATDKGVDCHFSSLPSLKAAREVAAAFAALTKTTSTPRISPKIETISASLYAQARNKMIQIEVNGDGKTDEQIQAEIESKLAAEGFKGSLVYLKTDSTGRRNIQLNIQESDSGQVGGSSEMERTIVIDSRGKTAEQLQNEMKEKLIENGHANSNINVKVEGSDSLRKVEIEIRDTTGH